MLAHARPLGVNTFVQDLLGNFTKFMLVKKTHKTIAYA